MGSNNITPFNNTYDYWFDLFINYNKPDLSPYTNLTVPDFNLTANFNTPTIGTIPQFNESLTWDNVIGNAMQGLANPFALALGKLKSSQNTNVNEIPTTKTGGLNKAASTMGIVGAIADLGSSLLPLKTEYEGPKGQVTQTIDQVYDTAANTAMTMGPIGAIVGGAMKAGDFLGKGLNALGGGTDGRSNVDAILGSSFFSWNIGALNGFLGTKADKLYKDDEAFAKVGGSYTAVNLNVDKALEDAGKKFGVFSSGSLKKANDRIDLAGGQMRTMADIADNTTDRFAIRNSMSAINGYRRQLLLQGGFQRMALVKQGGVLAKRVVSRYKMEQKRKSITKEIIPEIELSEFKEGGSLVKETIIQEISLEVPEFKEGGSFNVIPDGALHARLHHMEDDDNITKKGIPVVSEDENGKIEQHAEIEKEEIIFRLSVTKRLEELAKEDTDESAIEAGKLLVEEILNNTVDNTNNLL